MRTIHSLWRSAKAPKRRVCTIFGHGRARPLQHVAIVPVPANHREPAHEHADLRCFLATDSPDDARPESAVAQLQWLTTDEAIRLTTEENVRETIRRLELVLAG